MSPCAVKTALPSVHWVVTFRGCGKRPHCDLVMRLRSPTGLQTAIQRGLYFSPSLCVWGGKVDGLGFLRGPSTCKGESVGDPCSLCNGPALVSFSGWGTLQRPEDAAAPWGWTASTSVVSVMLSQFSGEERGAGLGGTPRLQVEGVLPSWVPGSISLSFCYIMTPPFPTLAT